MDNRIKDSFDAVQTPQRLKRKTKAVLRKKTFDYGRNVLQQRRHRSRLAGALLSAVLIMTVSGIWFFPATSIAVDINPSIELKVNALDRVITLKGRNSDGAALVKGMDVSGMTYDDAMQRILLSSGLEPYLENGSAITITVAGSSNDHGEEMLSRVLCRAYNIADEENICYYQVDWDTLRAAREAGLCIPRYLAWQQLKRADPGITAEDVRQLPKEEIRALAQIKKLENPCGE